MFRYLSCSIIFFTLISCTSKKEEKIVELESLHRYYTALYKEIPADLIEYCTKENSLRGLLDESYITPKIHSSIMGVWGPYANTCQIIEDELGKILSYKLEKIIDKGLVYSFHYSLVTTKVKNPVTLELFLNKEYGLSEFHIYILEGKEYRNILFPKSEENN
ncbi:hypothetical protein HME9304_02490 [Flagellimonas maritima]|uniref:Uncharacterized protein n=1 Tax=Flagellimonas maritima TaxID=1383885 RepID=A0A2Z4LU94_9FLAO|nr:hypothetical protein [Allomuricauda aurantiaca]AWX45471.1 hypothetical protein HME9304_02490 [Allomuricauda aurantiaca]